MAKSKAIQLNEFLTEHKIPLEQVIFDGHLRRFSRENRSSGECWIICFDSEGFQSIVFGDWSEDSKYTWHSKTQRFKIEQQKELARRLDHQRKEYEKGRRELNEKAKQRAQEIMLLPMLKEPNQYCLKKKIAPEYGAKVIQYKDENCLAIPILNHDLEIVNVQTINNSGKKFLYGGEISNCFLVMESSDDSKESKVFVCEGYATGWSLAKVLDDLNYSYEIYCVFTANNIKKVISSILSDKKEIIICADNDRFKEKNTGLETALQCEDEFQNVKVFLPNFGSLDKGTDANDICVFIGDYYLKAQLKEFFEKIKQESISLPKPDYSFFEQNELGGFSPLYHRMGEYFRDKLNVVLNSMFYVKYNGTHFVDYDEMEIAHTIDKLCGPKISPSQYSGFIKMVEAKCFKDKSVFSKTQSGLINFKNGTLEIEGRKFRDHKMSDSFFYCLDRNYVTGASCPEWEKFLLKIMLDDKNSVDIIQEIFGYCLMGGVPIFEKSFLFIGDGQNGKGTVTKTLTKMIGSENVSSVPLHALSTVFSAVRIKDKLVNISGEVNRKVVESDAFKLAVAGEPISMAYKNKNEFDYAPVARFIIACNKMPFFDEVTDAITRRFIMLSFKYRPNEKEIEPNLIEKFYNEIDGITLWALDGLDRLLKNRKFSESQNSIETLEQFKLDRDNVKRFADIALEFVKDESKIVDSSSVRQSYLNFCSDEGTAPVSKQEFGRRLNKIFPEKVTDRSGALRFYKNLYHKEYSPKTTSVKKYGSFYDKMLNS